MRAGFILRVSWSLQKLPWTLKSDVKSLVVLRSTLSNESIKKFKSSLFQFDLEFPIFGDHP